MAEYAVAEEGEIGDGERLAVHIEGREIFVFNFEGEYHAYHNWCPHQSGPACEGVLTSTETATFDRDSLELEVSLYKEGKVLKCPWHAWEFDVTSGECLSRKEITLVSYPVRVEDGEVVVSV